MQGDVEKQAALFSAARGLLGKLKPSKVLSATKEVAPKFFHKAISEPDVEKAWKGYKQLGGGGSDSLLMYLPELAAEKVFGKDKVQNAAWRAIHRPALKADTAVGHTLGKIPGLKKLFTTTEKVPWGDKLHKEISRSSALAPLTKLRDLGAPVIVGVGLEKALKKTMDLAKGHGDTSQMHDREMREKVASTMLRLHEENKGHTKRAHAMRLLFKKAELGLEQIPHNYMELEEKLASLVNQDLVVLEKALELTGGQFKLGELDASRVAGVNATEKFQAAVLGDEL